MRVQYDPREYVRQLGRSFFSGLDRSQVGYEYEFEHSTVILHMMGKSL